MHLPRAVSIVVFALFGGIPLAATAAEGLKSLPKPSSPESAIERWPLAIAVGGGLNLSGHPTGEATILPDVAGPYVSLGYTETGGGRRAYVEAGVWLLLSMAAGVGYHSGADGTSHWGFHAFLGLPIPIIGWGHDGLSTPLTGSFHIAPVLLYVEPFYRPEFRKGAPVEHEAGLLLKIRVGLTTRQWTMPGLNPAAGMHEL
jgi:hypothetical protein